MIIRLAITAAAWRRDPRGVLLSRRRTDNRPTFEGLLPKSNDGRARHSVRAAYQGQHSKSPDFSTMRRRARSDAPYLVGLGRFLQHDLQAWVEDFKNLKVSKGR